MVSGRICVVSGCAMSCCIVVAVHIAICTLCMRIRSQPKDTLAHMPPTPETFVAPEPGRIDRRLVQRVLPEIVMLVSVNSHLSLQSPWPLPAGTLHHRGHASLRTPRTVNPLTTDDPCPDPSFRSGRTPNHTAISIRFTSPAVSRSCVLAAALSLGMMTDRHSSSSSSRWIDHSSLPAGGHVV